MNRNVSHSPEVSLDSNESQGHSPEPSQSESDVSHQNTAALLKSFIKDNLHAKSESSSGGTSSSDESSSAELDWLRQKSDDALGGSRDSVTPEPQPLTRSNVTLHDGIWQTEEDVSGASGHRTPVSLSPPLKGLRVLQYQHGTDVGRRSWERGFLEQSLSDAESDQSYSSQDTMILKSTKDAACGYLKYMELYGSARASASGEEPSPRQPLVCSSDAAVVVDDLSNIASGSGEGQKQSEVPSQSVRFVNDVQFEDSEMDASALYDQPQRSLNVDYARLLRGGSGNGEHGDQDDGYESTDNASSTSSSSNGTDQQGGTMSLPEAMKENAMDKGATNLKTAFGYVDRTRVPNFRRMNMELRRKAVTKSAQNLMKTSVEDKIRALCINTAEENDTLTLFPEGSSVTNPELAKPPEGIEFQPRDASSPTLQEPSAQSSPTESMYRIGELSLIGNHQHNSAINVATDKQCEVNLVADSSAGCRMDGMLVANEIPSMYPHSGGTGEEQSNIGHRWDSKTPVCVPIPSQPRRPAPILKDSKTSPLRSYESIANMNAVHREQSVAPSVEQPTSEYYPSNLSSLAISAKYRSQPQLQTDSEEQQFGTMSSMFKSEPELQPGQCYGAARDLSEEQIDSSIGAHHCGQSQGLYQPEVGNWQSANSQPGDGSNYTDYLRYPNPVENRHRSESPFRSESFHYKEQKALSPHETANSPRSPSLQLNTGFSQRPASPGKPASPIRSVSSDKDTSEYSRGTLQRYPNQPLFGTLPGHVSTVKQSDTLNHFAQTMTLPSQPTDIPGVFVYRSGLPRVQQAASEEHLNTSGSTGSNDSGIEHNGVDTNPNSGYSQSLSQTDLNPGHRAPVNYTLDDISRDPMSLVEKVKRRREAAPMVRLQHSMTPPLLKFPEKGVLKGSALLCQPGQFAAPSSKDLTRMRAQNRASPVGSKLHPVKALPIGEPADQGSQTHWDKGLDTTAQKILNSQGSKMQEEYARYLQLYSNFQRQASSGDEAPAVSATSDAFVVDDITGKVDTSELQGLTTNVVDSPYRSGSSTEPTAAVRDSAPTIRSHSMTAVKYMRTADIYRMLEEQRGPPRISRSQPTTPTKITNPEWGQPRLVKPLNNSFESLQQTGNCEIVRQAPDSHRGYVYGNEAAGGVSSVPEQREGAMLCARNAEIYSLYTGGRQRRLQPVSRGEDASQTQPTPAFHI